MASLDDFDFTGYLYDPTLPDRDLISALEKFPEFKVHISKHISRATVIRYIIMMYDFNTEMPEYFPDYMVRKREVARISGFKLRDGDRFREEVEDILIGENQQVNDMIVRYVKLFENPDYVTYVSYWSMLNAEVVKSLAANDAKEVKIIRENIDKLRQTIGELSREIFKGDDSKSLRRALYRGMERDKLGIRPEEKAEMFAPPGERLQLLRPDGQRVDIRKIHAQRNLHHRPVLWIIRYLMKYYLSIKTQRGMYGLIQKIPICFLFV